MGPKASQITSLTIVYSTVYSGADQRKASKLCVTGLCAGNSPGTGEFPAQMASNAENISIRWRHHDFWCPNAFAQAVHQIYAIQMYELLSQRQRSSFYANVWFIFKVQVYWDKFLWLITQIVDRFGASGNPRKEGKDSKKLNISRCCKYTLSTTTLRNTLH